MSDSKINKADFSQTAIKKAVLKNTLQHPGVLYPTTIGVLGGLAAVVLGPTLPLLGVCAAGLAIGSGGWLINYTARNEYFANEYVKHLHETMRVYRDNTFQNLENDLREVQYKKGIQQFRRLREKFDAFESMLNKKLNPAELTYSRYLGIAEQVYLSAIDNLHRIASSLKGVQSIDDHYLIQRIKQLDAVRNRDANQEKELASLLKRKELKSTQLDKIDTYYAQNEEAMTQIDITLAAIADIQTIEGHASMDIESAMSELQELARRADDYSLK